MCAQGGRQREREGEGGRGGEKWREKQLPSSRSSRHRCSPWTRTGPGEGRAGWSPGRLSPDRKTTGRMMTSDTIWWRMGAVVATGRRMVCALRSLSCRVGRRGIHRGCSRAAHARRLKLKAPIVIGNRVHMRTISSKVHRRRSSMVLLVSFSQKDDETTLRSCPRHSQ